MAVAVGSAVWVEDPEVAWIDGEVVEVNGEEIKINLTSGRTVCFMFPNFLRKRLVSSIFFNYIYFFGGLIARFSEYELVVCTCLFSLT